MSFFDRLKSVIKEKNTTFSDVEKAVGFGRGTIGKWKKSSPSYENIMKVINYLKVDLYYLMQDELKFSKENSIQIKNKERSNKDSFNNSNNTYNISNSFNEIKSDEKMIIELLLKKFLKNNSNSILSDKEEYILSIYNKLSEDDKIKIEGIIENKLSIF